MGNHAIDDSTEATTYIGDASKDDGRNYSCPECGSAVLIRGGDETAVRAHFAHPPGEACEYYDNPEEGELHRTGKDGLVASLESYSWVDAVEREYQLDRSKPDILVHTDAGERVGIELQVSSTSAESIRERTLNRSADGIYTLWLFHVDGFPIKESRNGNRYVTFRGGEYGYQSLFGIDGAHPICYYDPERSPRGVGYAVTIEPFDDEPDDAPGAGFIDRETTIKGLETFTSVDGYRLALPGWAVPGRTGDHTQMNLAQKW